MHATLPDELVDMLDEIARAGGATRSQALVVAVSVMLDIVRGKVAVVPLQQSTSKEAANAK